MARVCGQGAKTQAEAAKLENTLRIIPCYEIQKNTWIDAGKRFHELCSNKVTIPMTAIFIAIVAQKHRCKIATLDHHFDHFRELLYRPE